MLSVTHQKLHLAHVVIYGWSVWRKCRRQVCICQVKSSANLKFIYPTFRILSCRVGDVDCRILKWRKNWDCRSRERRGPVNPQPENARYSEQDQPQHMLAPRSGKPLPASGSTSQTIVLRQRRLFRVKKIFYHDISSVPNLGCTYPSPNTPIFTINDIGGSGLELPYLSS
jgi:hypothetical protein